MGTEVEVDSGLLIHIVGLFGSPGDKGRGIWVRVLLELLFPSFETGLHLVQGI